MNGLAVPLRNPSNTTSPVSTPVDPPVISISPSTAVITILPVPLKLSSFTPSVLIVMVAGPVAVMKLSKEGS